MCGITGIISQKALTDQDRKSVDLMNSKLAHRGPDSEGTFEFDHLKASMRRLSIIDLALGSQPLWNEDGSISLIANGEIYNFIELRNELEKLGHTFKTSSDCETIIHAYEEFGDNFMEKLRGMFAFCLFDSTKDKVLLARDRLGEKPLYLYETDSLLAFSSEFKSLISLIKKEDRKINLDSLNLYFHYQFVPEPHTLIQGVRKVSKGTLLTINTKTFTREEKKYWTMGSVETKENNPPEKIRSVLNEVEKIIIRSDVPIGVCLSGGIDSSLIAILSQKYSDKKIHAFSVGYVNSPDNDERKKAEKLAKDLAIDFHDIEISKEEFSRDFKEMIRVMDDPIADIAGYGYYQLSKTARECGVPVLFAGFGGDELFWGYEWVHNSVTFNKLKHGFSRLNLFVKLLKYYIAYVKKSPFQTLYSILKMSFSRDYIFYELTPGFFTTHINYEKIFSNDFRKRVDGKAPFSFFKNPAYSNPEISSCTLLYDLWMVGNCLPLGDRTSMAHSVEMRLPLLDYKLIDETLALRKTVPGDYLLGYKKWLIEATKDILPREIVERKKRGFTPPTTEWIEELVEKNKEKILGGYLISKNIVNKKYVLSALNDVRANKDFLYKYIVLEEWISSYII